MIIDIFNKRLGSPNTKPINFKFTLNKNEFCVHLQKFHFWYHRKTKDTPRRILQLIIGYKSMYNLKNNKGFLYINTEYNSTKHVFGHPIQRFLKKSYL